MVHRPRIFQNINVYKLISRTVAYLDESPGAIMCSKYQVFEIHHGSAIFGGERVRQEHHAEVLEVGILNSVEEDFVELLDLPGDLSVKMVRNKRVRKSPTANI